MKKSVLLTFLFSFVPGFGQMYQGYMKRGLSLTFWFAASIVLTAIGFNVFVVGIIITWAYSFFDTFNIRNLTDNQRAAFTDEYMPSEGWLRKEKIIGGKKMATPKIVGWALIIIGVFVFLQKTVGVVIRWIANFFNIWYGDFYTIFIAVAIIAIGVFMVRRNAKNNSDGSEGGGS